MKADRIGLFGGTFDPPHFGHVAALKAAVATKQFDYIEVTVAGDPYQKSSSVQLHSADVRLKMAHAAFDGIEGVRVSDREIKRNGPSYTIETVRELLNDAEHVDLLIGADLSSQLDSWHESVLLRSLVKVGVIPRPGGDGMHIWCQWIRLTCRARSFVKLQISMKIFRIWCLTR